MKIFGRKIKHSERNRLLNERWTNDGLYDEHNQVRNFPCKDNKNYYNGSGYAQGHVVRVPSIKRNKTTWSNFYKLFPRYKDIMLSALNGEIKAIVKKEYVTVEISHHHNFSQTVKLKIVK